MSDTMDDPNKNDPNEGALAPTVAEGVDRARPPAQQLRRTARATHRAMEGWQRVTSEHAADVLHGERVVVGEEHVLAVHALGRAQP
jgi:hypothetical protein